MSALSSFEFNDETTVVGDSAFRNCTTLRFVDFNNVKELGEYAFAGDVALGQRYVDAFNDITVGADVIGDYAFSGCTALESVQLTAAAKIGAYAFQNCSALTEVKFAANGVAVGDSAFNACLALTKIDLTNVSTLGKYAFYGCTELEDVIGAANFTSSHAYDGTKYAENLEKENA